ncbi:MAG: hypothetical protein ABIE84_02005 [bacterium]
MAEIFDPTFSQLEHSMEIASRWQEVITHNIANAKTPGYNALTFDEELMKAVERDNNKMVNLEQEMSELAKNSSKYSSYIKLLSSKLNVMRTIATQGRR